MKNYLLLDGVLQQTKLLGKMNGGSCVVSHFDRQGLHMCQTVFLWPRLKCLWNPCVWDFGQWWTQDEKKIKGHQLYVMGHEPTEKSLGRHPRRRFITAPRLVIRRDKKRPVIRRTDHFPIFQLS